MSEADDARVEKIMKVRNILLDRDEARASGNFVKSDTLRDELKALGVEVIDQKGGPSGWKFSDGSSKKLRAGSGVEMPSAKKRSIEAMATSSSAPSERPKGVENSVSKKLKIAEPKGKKEGKKTSSEEQMRNKAALRAVLGVTANVTNVKGVLLEDLTVGTGKVAENGKKVKVYYSGKLKSTGKVFDASLTKPFAFKLGRSEVIPGWDIGVAGMRVGGKRRLTCPPEKAYGRVGAPPTIPPNSTLIFDVTLLEVI